MDSEEVVGEPSRRQWVGYWSMIVQQTQNAFNDKAAQFILIPLGGVVGYHVESAAGLMIALPFVLFAPMAGWMSDRFSKRDVMLGAAVAQVFILAMISAAVFWKDMRLALVGFFLLAVQSAFFSPAKIGINKELVGSGHLGFAAGVQQMMAMLAMLAGQISAGFWYDRRYEALGGVAERAWDAAFFPLILLTCLSVPAVVMALVVPRVSGHGRGGLSGRLLFSHFRDMRELWVDRELRLASFGVAYFWGFAAFINLWSVKVARAMTEGGAGFGTLASVFMVAASLGMAVGFGFASWLLRKKIELGWVPLCGLAMTGTALVLAFLVPGGWAFLVVLGLLAFFAALFLAPLSAWKQDRYPAEKRGELQAAVNLQDCFAGIVAVVFIEVVIHLLKLLGMPEMGVFQVQMVLLALSCGIVTWMTLRILPRDFIRLICLPVVRVVYRMRFTGRERIPKEGGVLLLPNHVTFLDVFFISAVSEREVKFVMDERFMGNGVIRFAVGLFGMVPIRRDQPLEAIRRTIEVLGRGEVVVLFAEGQLTRTGMLCELERGFELIAKKAMCPIFPVWVDGSWGSIFSFERGRFFRKLPRRVPLALSVAVGRQMEARPTRKVAQAALLRAGAEAFCNRFPRGETEAAVGAQRLASCGAILWGEVLDLLEGELDAGVCGTLGEFAKLTGGRVKLHKGFTEKAGRNWVGGPLLRGEIENAGELGEGIVFREFGEVAASGFPRKNVTQFACLALDGVIVSVSMADPPREWEESLYQAGQRAGGWGKLLPGLYVEDGLIQPVGVRLPEGVVLDDGGFLVRKSAGTTG